MSAIAWAAGVYEGEGTVYMQVRPDGSRSPIAILKVTMSDLDVIERLRLITGRGSVALAGRRKRAEHHKTLYRWITYGSNARAVIDLFWPWLGNRRREQAATVWPELDDRPTARQP